MSKMSKAQVESFRLLKQAEDRIKDILDNHHEELSLYLDAAFDSKVRDPAISCAISIIGAELAKKYALLALESAQK